MPYKNKKDKTEQSRRWRRNNKVHHLKLARNSQAKYNLEAKIQVLSHYGREGKLQCCWPGCEISDIDVMNLDHVKDDGVKDRNHKGNCGSGSRLYRLLRAENYPEGYQTLCANHNLKKEILRRRSDRINSK